MGGFEERKKKGENTILFYYLKTLESNKNKNIKSTGFVLHIIICIYMIYVPECGHIFVIIFT